MNGTERWRREMSRTRLVIVCLMVFCLASAFTLVPREANGQVLIGLLLGDKVTSEKFHLSLNIGANFSDLKGMEDTKIRPGFFLGLGGEWRFAEHWFLQPEIGVFYYVGANNLPMDYFPPPPEVEDIVTGNEVSRRLNYFTIPVLLKYGVAGNRLHLGAGGQVGFLTSAQDKYEGTSDNGNPVTVDQDIKDYTVSTDLGLLFNVEYKFKPDVLSMGIVARYYLGLTDTVKDNPGDPVYNSVFSVLLTVPIGEIPEQDTEGEG
jgi:hypothetical protein